MGNLGPTVKLVFAGDSAALEKTVDNVESKLGGLSKGISAKGAAFAGAGALVGQQLAAGFGRSLENGALQDELAAAVGDPAKSAEMGKVAGSVYAQAYGGSLADVNGAVEAVNSSLQGLGGGALEGATKKALDFAKVFKIDVTESTQAVGILIKSGLAKDANEGFDLITRGAQKVPVALRGDLLETVNEYGSVFADLGYTGSQTFGILVEASQRGGIALDKVGDVIKEMSLKATDGSKTTVDAYKAIGLNSDEMANKLLAGGAQSQEAITSIASGLLSIQDPAERSRQAIALFGTPLEDLGVNKIPDFLTSLRDGAKGMDGVSGAADAMGKTLNDNASTKIEEAKRSTQQWVDSMVNADGPMGDFAANVAAFGPDGLAAAGSIALIVTAVKDLSLFTPIATAAQWLWNAAMTANPIGLIIVGIGLLVAAIVWIATQTTWFQDLWNMVWGGITTAFHATVDAIVWAATTMWQSFQELGGKIGGVFSSIGDGVKGAFRAAFNFVADAWNNTVGSLSFSVPSWVPGIGGNNFSAPKLPKFHTGGLVPGAPGTEMMALLQAGERVTSANEVRNGSGETSVVFKSDGSRMGDAILAVVEEALRKQSRGKLVTS